MRKRYLSLASLLLALVLPVTALAQSGSNGNYYQFNTRSDGQIGTPPTGKIRFFWNGSSLRYKLPNGSFVNVGGGGSSFDKLTQSGTNNGTLTLYDDTAVTGATNLKLRQGAVDGEILTVSNSGNTKVLSFETVGMGLTIGISGSGQLSVGADAGNNSLWGGAGGLHFPAGGSLFWYPSPFAADDLGLARASAGVLKVTDGSSGYGGLIATQLDLTHGITGGGSQVITLSTDQSFYTTGAGGWRFLTIYNGEVYVGGVDAAQAGDLHLRTAGTDRWNVLQAGGLQPGADKTYDIGDSTHYVRDLYLLSSLYKLVATAAAGSPTVDLATGAIQEVTLSDIDGAHTITWSNIKAGAVYTITILQDATDGGETVTWDSHTKWAAGTAPTLTSAAGSRDVFTFYSDGTNLYETGRTLDVR